MYTSPFPSPPTYQHNKNEITKIVLEGLNQSSHNAGTIKKNFRTLVYKTHAIDSLVEMSLGQLLMYEGTPKLSSEGTQTHLFYSY